MEKDTWKEILQMRGKIDRSNNLISVFPEPLFCPQLQNKCVQNLNNVSYEDELIIIQ